MVINLKMDDVSLRLLKSLGPYPDQGKYRLRWLAREIEMLTCCGLMHSSESEIRYWKYVPNLRSSHEIFQGVHQT